MNTGKFQPQTRKGIRQIGNAIVSKIPLVGAPSELQDSQPHFQQRSKDRGDSHVSTTECDSDLSEQFIPRHIA